MYPMVAIVSNHWSGTGQSLNLRPMVHYLGDSSHQNGGANRVGVLLANLGTPDGPDPSSVRRFLAEFLWDPRVVEAPRLIWWLALHGVILRIRPSKSAHAYQQIWTPEGSPLLVYSSALAKRIGEALESRWNAPVALGMSYGSPSIPQALDELRRQGATRIVVLPLYPQYSGTTTASVFDRVTRYLQRWRWVPELRFIGSYHDDAGYIDALAASIDHHWRAHEKHHLLFSFHGIPKRYVTSGDPYYSQSMQTARLVAERLSLGEQEWSVSFQSQVGREEWLRPYTDERLLEYARSGPKKVTLVCPGFATDCLETLEEIALRNRQLFLDAGGEAYDYVPALNAGDAHVAALAQLLERHMQGWA
ncbi:ferrochelatase [Peristeroidobacter soli]|jgi:ferrochelatase|uniref:ferrochelatase n=1 Tax=Peristeroidobacter soli TaxID=2497877 RepID=UPI001C3789B9|nr:ferrochelatase [Peristeroidobacter soli]